MRFEILEGRFVTLCEPDGHVLLASGLQTSAMAAHAVVIALRFRLHLREAIEVRRREGQWFFVVTDFDGTVLAASPLHDTPESCEQACRSVRDGARDARVVEIRAGDVDGGTDEAALPDLPRRSSVS